MTPPDLAYGHRVNAVIPLALLQTIRLLDRTDPVDLEEYASEVAPRRLGMSATVAAQIERYQRHVKRGGDVAAEDVRQLFRLVARRNDAQLAFSHAGRLAARRAQESSSLGGRLVYRVTPAAARARFGLNLANRAAQRAFGASLWRNTNGGIVAVVGVPLAASEAEAVWCGFFGAALAEVLRTYTEFDGALEHSACIARGDAECRWESGVSAS